MRRLAILITALFGIALGACKRPVEGREIVETRLHDLRVSPPFLTAGVPIDLSFRVSGIAPAKVTFDIAGKPREECTPVRESDDRFHCTHPGVTRNDYVEGPTLVVVEARDQNDRSSVITAPITIDFQCPRFVSLTLTPEIAQPGDTVTVTIEATEVLGEPPIVTHGGLPWEVAKGQGQSYSVTHRVTIADPQMEHPVVVRLRDRAGNTSTECGEDGMKSFAVDHTPPAIDISLISLLRDVPGAPSILTAAPTAFRDDVGIVEVRVYDETGATTHARIVPDADGSISETSIAVQPRTRVLVEAVDRFGRTSERMAIPETWTLSIGAGATPNAVLRTASRFSAAPPHSRSMRLRTAEGAAAVLRADARYLTERTRIAFEKVGDLPSSYEDLHLIIAGYEPVRRNIVAVGGHRGLDFNLFAGYVSSVLYLSWDEERGEYIFEQAPSLVKTQSDLASQIAAGAPSPRYGRNLAFDGKGCGVLFGGNANYLRDDGSQTITLQGDTWQLCATANGYEWTRIPIEQETEEGLLWRIAPIIYDPTNERYVVAGGGFDDEPVVLFIETDPNPRLWSIVSVEPLPSAFVSRSQALLYYDPLLDAYAYGMGYSQLGSGQQGHWWIYQLGQWTLNSVPYELEFRAYFGADYDRARQQVVLWGGDSTGFSSQAPDPKVWFLTGTASTSPSAWRSAFLDNPLARDWPSVVYDSDREMTVVFGGVRLNDSRVVEPEIHQIVAQPSSPYLQATIDLDAPRPKGITHLRLVVRAAGTGDGDGVGPLAATAGGVIVKLWDHREERWDDVAITEGAPGAITEAVIDVTVDPDRYIAFDGTVPLTVTTRYPATEAVAGRLDVDLISGYLSLRPGIVLP